MAITRVQSVSTAGTDLPYGESLALASPISVGSEIFVSIAGSNNGPTVTAVTDSLHNRYTLIDHEAGGSFQADLWKAQSVNAGTCAVTPHWSSSKSGAVTIVEYSVAAGKSLILNQQNANSTTVAGTNHNHGSITTTEAVELIFTTAGVSQPLPAASLPASFTAIRDAQLLLVMEWITSSTQTTDAAFTTSLSATSACIIASFIEDDHVDVDTRVTQLARYTLESMPGADVKARLTQMGRQVAYAFTCDTEEPPVEENPTIFIDRLDIIPTWELLRLDAEVRQEEAGEGSFTRVFGEPDWVNDGERWQLLQFNMKKRSED